MNKRQSLTLQERTLNIIEKDMKIFNISKKIEIFNRIIENFDKFNTQEFINFYYGKSFNTAVDEIIENIINDTNNKNTEIFLKAKFKTLPLIMRKKLEQLTFQSKKEKTCVYRLLLNEKNYQKLLNNQKEKKEDPVYKKMATFISTIIESYSSLSLYEKEKILFKNEIIKLEEFISKRSVLEIERHSTKLKINFQPCKINKINSNDLTVISGYVLNSENKIDSIPLYDINLKTIKVKDLKPVELENSDFENILKVKIEFTQNGLMQYERQYENRPEYIEKLNETTFVFESTRNNIIKYFLKFGPNAKILEPIELKTLFLNIYKHAYIHYKS